MKVKAKELAVALRKQGKSYKEILLSVKVSKSTLSVWFKDLPGSAETTQTLIEKNTKISTKRLLVVNTLRRKQLDDLYTEAEKQATGEFPKLLSEMLFVAGLNIYWGEGDKLFKNGMVRVSNVDRGLQKVFIKFLHEICGVPVQNIRIGILLYPDLKPGVVENYWSNTLDIPREQFFKSTTIQGKHKTKRSEYGV
jgi:hypothetical protein